MSRHHILVCQCANSDIISDSIYQEILAALTKNKHQFTIIPDLCGATAQNDPRLEKLISQTSMVIACYPRAVRWLFERGGAPLPEDIFCLNMRVQSAEDILRSIENHASPANLTVDKWQNIKGWIPWFPVIDYERCVSCKQCSSYCLFGVYQVLPDGKVEVTQPDACKNNCPACARICPEAAIIFPKLAESPINGDDISNEDALKAKIKINVEDIMGDDIYAALAARKKKARRLRLRKSDHEKANEERDRALIESGPDK